LVQVGIVKYPSSPLRLCGWCFALILENDPQRIATYGCDAFLYF